ncbi:glycine betaine/L-proline ABC transporter ATP-binding protein [Martelella mediterranea]|uniref:quaternary amine ABC transporter ATP-binding protein n=1 Tax=Martelella mediterranea TaxID=293089 RepID=UPI001E3F3955|nr:glycine betaine/L-proline ABC transporter ATP-binding protein [Martelella mediterranea]MCD1636321.1 glycine betaine/L-proline ABC transporter ATP-binding protein [Martelella mediterranea]
MSVKLTAKNVSKLFNDDDGEGARRLAAGESKEDIFKATGVTVGIDNVSFDVNEGEIFVIMGLSGSGKSTIVRTLNGLIPPTSGQIIIDNVDVASCDKETLREVRRKKITMVFQHFALFPHKTIIDNVAFGLKLKGMGKEERHELARASLAKVGLEAYANSYPSQLSGGMQQRVGLARGLANDPEILLMDEPFGALDPLIRREMQDELIVLQKELKKTIIFITHDLNEAMILGDRIAIMKDGAFVQVGTAQEIVSEPADDYVRAFVSDIDRSRVFKVSDISRDAAWVKVDSTAADALAVMDKAKSDLAYVVEKGVPVGLLMRSDAMEAQRTAPVRDVMYAEPPTVSEESYLNEVYGAAQAGVPMAVTDDDGKLVGVVDQEAIFEQLASETEEPPPQLAQEEAKKQAGQPASE